MNHSPMYSLIAACTLSIGIYFTPNAAGAVSAGDSGDILDFVEAPTTGNVADFVLVDSNQGKDKKAEPPKKTCEEIETELATAKSELAQAENDAAEDLKTLKRLEDALALVMQTRPFLPIHQRQAAELQRKINILKAKPGVKKVLELRKKVYNLNAALKKCKASASIQPQPQPQPTTQLPKEGDVCEDVGVCTGKVTFTSGTPNKCEFTFKYYYCNYGHLRELANASYTKDLFASPYSGTTTRIQCDTLAQAAMRAETCRDSKIFQDVYGHIRDPFR